MHRDYRIGVRTARGIPIEIHMRLSKRRETRVEAIAWCDSLEQAQALIEVMRDGRNPAKAAGKIAGVPYWTVRDL